MGLAMGAGICAMHYTGMAAMRADIHIAYDPLLVALSYVVAAGASVGALVAAARDRALPGSLAAAGVLGAAIVGMHYTGMAAMRLVHVTPDAHAGHAPVAVPAMFLALAVAIGTLILLVMTIAAAGLGRRFEVLAAREADTLRRGRAELQAVLEQMPMAVMIAEAPSGRITFGNAEALRLLGAGGDPRLERPDEEAGESGGDPLLRALEGEPIERERWRRRTDDGRMLTLEVSAAPVRDASGDISMAVLAAQDVTVQLEAEEALRQSQKLDGLGQLTGGVAHDFNNLLTAVLGSLELAARRVDDERALRLMATATEAARRGARLTGQLLAFSRRQRLQTVAVDVNGLIRRMQELLASTLGGTIRVERRLSAGLPPTLADPVQLEMALLNLAINARDAMPTGGKLIFSTRKAKIDAAGSGHEPGPGEYVAVTVTDDGAGMSSETLAKAVEPFFTTKAVGKGSGLGLSQVAGLAKQLGGGMSIRSAPGEGTAVTLYLPRAGHLAAVPSEPRAEAVAVAPQGAVLVVDDDDDVRRYVGELLTEAGLQVTALDGGPAALARLAAGVDADVLLVDYAMPGMNGAEVIRRAQALRPDLPALIMTGYLDPDSLPEDVDSHLVLQKPFEGDQLLERLTGLMEARARR